MSLGAASKTSAATARARSTSTSAADSTAVPPTWSDFEPPVPPPRTTSSVSPWRTVIASIGMPVWADAIMAKAV